MLIDCHVHSRGNEGANEVIKAMDRVGVDKAIIIVPYPGKAIDYRGKVRARR